MREKHSYLHLLRRVARMARPYWLHLAGVFALCVVQTPLALLNPLPVKIVVDSVLGGHPLPSAVAWAVPSSASSMARLWLAAGLLVALTLLVYLESLASWWLRTYAGEKLTVEFRAALFRHTQ